MIINELTYQETAIEACDLEGGVDLAVTFNQYKQNLSLIETASTSGAGGSTSVVKAQNLKIDTTSFSLIGLGV